MFHLFFQIGDVGFMVWLPTILKNLIQQGMAMVGLLSAVPFLAAMAGLYVIAYHSDKSGKRRVFLAIPGIRFAAAFILSVQTKEVAMLSFGFLVICGLFHNAYNGVFWTLPPKLFTREVCGGARGFINGIGNLGGFIGPYLAGWIITTFGDTSYAIYMLSAFQLAAFLIAVTCPRQIDDDAPRTTSNNVHEPKERLV